MIRLVIGSIDWQCLVGFIGLELVLAWVKWVDGAPTALPPPDTNCIDRGEPPHYVRHDAWNVGQGRVRHS